MSSNNTDFVEIWISPVVANLNTSTPYGLPYHGYWAQDIYSINPKFGTGADLKALSTALHGRGMVRSLVARRYCSLTDLRSILWSTW